MRTDAPAPSIGRVLFGKTRRAVLSLLYGHPEEDFYLRQIARAAGSGLGAVQRELKQLAEVGILRKRTRGRQVYFQANPDCPVFGELKGLLVKTAGVADVLRAALLPLADRIGAAFIHGSFARGDERRGSDVDLLVVGSATFAEVASALAPAQDALGREVNPTVYPPQEFRRRRAAGHHFLKSVLGAPRIFLVGDEGELKRLAG
ncbi:MAG: nucleotidyltransferase domain-containing protein [Nitrospinota bacterium]